MERISAFLNLYKSEHELLLDLAAKSRNTVSADLPDYILSLIHICIVPPPEERDYYTLVTMGMGAHRMNVPE